ncbi:hypothetical protein GFL62_00875 [Rhizobium leguminosarum bv. viciae]|nr:hypothetical protein [Rhizobium leguminosarum bv. viciae]
MSDRSRQMGPVLFFEGNCSPIGGPLRLEHFRFSSNHENALSLCFTQFRTQNHCTLLLELL